MFKLDSPLVRFLNKMADIMILNMLFIIFSIPVFTIGASFTATYYMAFKMIRNEENYIIKSFWKAFRENFVQATIMWLIMLVAAGVIVTDFRILAYSGIEFAVWMRIAVVVVTFVLLMGAVFIFPLQARFVNPVKNTIKNAFLMALSHLPTSVLLIAIYALPVLLMYSVPQLMPVILLMAFGAVIYGKSVLLLMVFKKYEQTPEELADDENEEVYEDDIAGSRREGAENDGGGIIAESEGGEADAYGTVAEQPEAKKVFRDGKFVDLSENSDGEAGV